MGLAEPAGDGLAVDLGCPLPVGAVHLWRVGVAATVLVAAAGMAVSDAARGDIADIGELGSELAVAALVGG